MDSFYENTIRPIEDRMMRSVWRITQHPDAAEEAFQDAVTTILRKRRAVLRHPNPQALILRICLNAGYDVLRKRSRRQRHESPPDEQMGRHPSEDARPDERAALGELRETILSAIGALPRRQAIAAMLRFVDEEPYAHIGEVLGCSEGTARTHVKRARAKLVHRRSATLVEIEETDHV